MSSAYLEADEARRLAEQRQLGSVSALEDEALNAVLLRASEWIDSCFNFKGEREEAQQPRAWPRHIEQAVMSPPFEVKLATLELSAALIVSDHDAELLLGLKPSVSRERIGDISISYHQGGPIRYSRIYQLLARTLRSPAHTKMVRS